MSKKQKPTNSKQQKLNIRVNESGLVYFWIAILILVLDLYTKYLANLYLDLYIPYPVLPSLNFTLVYNEGAAFGFLADAGGLQKIFFSSIAIFVSTILLYLLYKMSKKPCLLPIIFNLIIGGAMGNMIDRTVNSKVTDFIDFYIDTWHYATFNVADIAISVAAMLMIVNIFYELRLEKRLQKQLEKD